MALACSFCGACADDARRLVATEAGTAAICTECVLAVIGIFASDDEAGDLFVLTPHGREVARRIGEEAQG